MKSSVLALALAAGTAALPKVAFRAIEISRRFALNHHRVLSPHTIVRRSSRNFAARRTTSTASAGASLASATATASRRSLSSIPTIRPSGIGIMTATTHPTCVIMGMWGPTPPMCASNVVSMKGGGASGIIAGDPRPHVLDSSVSFNEICPTGCDKDDGISWIAHRWHDNDYCGDKNNLKDPPDGCWWDPEFAHCPSLIAQAKTCLAAGGP